MNADKLLEMSPKELDELFHESESGEVPNGIAKGTALIAPGLTCRFGVLTPGSFFGLAGQNI